MKRIIQSLALVALVSAAPAAWSDWNFGDADVGSSLPVASTYADRHLTEADKQRPGFDFGGPQEFASPLPIKSTYADRHANEPDRIARVAFPHSLPLMD